MNIPKFETNVAYEVTLVKKLTNATLVEFKKIKKVK